MLITFSYHAEGRMFEPFQKHFRCMTIIFLFRGWADSTVICDALKFLQIVLNIFTFGELFFPLRENN